MPAAYALVVINILCIFLCYQVALNRNADARFWGFMGFFFGPLALPFLVFAKPRDK
jgi:hypothetical protein